MSQNQEIIESKLCAYIDGELDTEGRAEIEKHLEANPQHRRLLESLRATRDLLRWLPREPAPAEIAETLNGQLERSVLLDEEGEQLGPGIWPKVFAAAAIVGLTAGLGVAVYYALPRSQSPAQLALHSAAPESGNADVVPAPLATTEESPRSDFARESGADREAYASKSGPSAMSLKEGDGAFQKSAESLADNAKAPARLPEDQKKSAELDQLAQQVAQNPGAFVPAQANGLAASANAVQNANVNGPSPVVLLVTSDSPAQTERQLTAYFNEQQIPWRQAPPASSMANALPATAPSAPATTRPAPPSEVAGRSESPDGANDNSLALKRSAAPAQFQPQQQASQLGMANNLRSEGVYVCQMSRRQAAQLGSTLANASGTVAQVQDLSNTTNNAAGGPEAQRSMKRAEGGPAERELLAKPSGVALKDAREAGAAAPAAPAVAGATTQPAFAESVAQQAGPPAIQPAAAPTTAPADEPVNVVIMVQSNPAATNAVAPVPAPTAPPEVGSQAGLTAQTQPATPPAATSQIQQQAK